MKFSRVSSTRFVFSIGFPYVFINFPKLMDGLFLKMIENYDNPGFRGTLRK